MFLNFFFFCLFFLISKEFLFYGEERLIVLSYLTLFTLLFFVLGSSLSESFQTRADVVKAEFKTFFESIIFLLLQTKTLIMNFSFFNLKILRLFTSVWFEFVHYYLHYFSFSVMKFNFFKFKINLLLASSSTVYLNILRMFNEKFVPSFLNKILSWKILSYSNWVRTNVSSNKVKLTSISVPKSVNSSPFWFISLKAFPLSSINSKFLFSVNKLSLNN